MNFDETMGTITTDIKGKVVTFSPRADPERGERKRPHKVAMSTRQEHITIGQFIAADCKNFGKPQVVLPLKELPSFSDKSLYDNIDILGQEKGWVTSATMLDIITKVIKWQTVNIEHFFSQQLPSQVFVPEIALRRQRLGQQDAPAILFWDGHTAHETEEIKGVLKEHNIISRLFLPHATHILQPLDLVIFPKFKKALKKVRQKGPTKQLSRLNHFNNTQYVKHQLSKHNKSLSAPERREMYIKCAVSALQEATTPLDIESAFASAGLWPLNASRVISRSVVTETAELAAEHEEELRKRKQRTGVRIDSEGYREGSFGVEEKAGKKKQKVMPKKKKQKHSEASPSDSSDSSSPSGPDDCVPCIVDCTTCADDVNDELDPEIIRAIKVSQTECEKEQANSRQVSRELQRRMNHVGKLYGISFLQHDTPGDGSCQFHAVLQCIRIGQVEGYKTLSTPQLRAQAVEWLKAHKDDRCRGGNSLEGFVDPRYASWDDYTTKMARPGVWGDALTLIAMAELLQITINVIAAPTTAACDMYHQTKPRGNPSQAVVWVALVRELHYSALEVLKDRK